MEKPHGQRHFHGCVEGKSVPPPTFLLMIGKEEGDSQPRSQGAACDSWPPLAHSDTMRLGQATHVLILLQPRLGTAVTDASLGSWGQLRLTVGCHVLTLNKGSFIKV